MSRLCLILFGSPGSGKGTQAKTLKETLGIAHISTGDMLRERVALGDRLGLRITTVMKTGGLVQDGDVNRMVEDRIAEDDCRSGFILDGYPRTVSQADWLAGRLAKERVRPMVVHLEVDYNIIIARIAGRRQCPICGTLYNLAAEPDRVACDLEGAKLEVRNDDREDVVRERLRAYDRQTAPVLAFFRDEGYSCRDFDGTEPPEVIGQQILDWIEKERRRAA
jgi:adenylate kinase